MLGKRRREGDDFRSVDSVQWALWATLMCACEKCGAEHELPHWSEPPWNDDVIAWADEWAPKVQALRWSMADDCFNLLCPACRPRLTRQPGWELTSCGYGTIWNFTGGPAPVSLAISCFCL
jgi:hypothetical protein